MKKQSGGGDVLSLLSGCSSGDEAGSDLEGLDCYARIFLPPPGDGRLPASLVSQCIVSGHRLRQSDGPTVNSSSVKNTVLQV